MPGFAPLPAPRPPTLSRCSRPSQGRPHVLPPRSRASRAPNTLFTHHLQRTADPQKLQMSSGPRPRAPSSRLLPAPPTAGSSQSETRSRHACAGAGRWVRASPRWVGPPERVPDWLGRRAALRNPGSHVVVTSEVRGRRPGFAVGCCGPLGPGLVLPQISLGVHERPVPIAGRSLGGCG